MDEISKPIPKRETPKVSEVSKIQEAPKDLQEAKEQKDNLDLQEQSEKNEVENKSITQRQELAQKIGYLNGESYDHMLKRAKPADMIGSAMALFGLIYGLYRLKQGNYVRGMLGLGIAGAGLYRTAEGRFPFQEKMIAKAKKANSYVKEKSADVLAKIQKKNPDMREALDQVETEKLSKNLHPYRVDFGTEQLKDMGVDAKIAEQFKPGKPETKELYKQLLELEKQAKLSNSKDLKELTSDKSDQAIEQIIKQNIPEIIV